MKAHLLNLTEVPWARLDHFGDRTVFQTMEWLQFIAKTQKASPVVAELRVNSEVAGYFTGLTIDRFGFRILGSSFPGWTTPYIGFNLVDGASRHDALRAIEALAFNDLRCIHMEVSDRQFMLEDGERSGFLHKFYESYETDLTQSEDEILDAMSSACRRCIRKAERSGVTVQEAHHLGFANEYYEQLKDVFGKQQLVPTYGVDRVQKLIQSLLPTGRLLLLRAIAPDGKCIGTGIYPGFNEVAEFWGNASFRSSQILRPNETLHWYAMRYWKAKGVKVFDWGGGGTYKEKYGARRIAVPWFYKSRFKVIGNLRDQAQRIIRMKQVVLGRLSTFGRALEQNT